MPRKQPPQPSIDVWYKTSTGDIFEVVAVDPQDDSIEIQYLDGSLEELDSDAWQSAEPKVIDPPHEAMGDDYEEQFFLVVFYLFYVNQFSSSNIR